MAENQSMPPGINNRDPDSGTSHNPSQPLSEYALANMRDAHILQYQIRCLANPAPIECLHGLYFQPANVRFIHLAILDPLEPMARITDIELFIKVQMCNHGHGGLHLGLHKYIVVYEMLSMIRKFMNITSSNSQDWAPDDQLQNCCSALVAACCVIRQYYISGNPEAQRGFPRCCEVKLAIRLYDECPIRTRPNTHCGWQYRRLMWWEHVGNKKGVDVRLHMTESKGEAETSVELPWVSIMEKTEVFDFDPSVEEDDHSQCETVESSIEQDRHTIFEDDEDDDDNDEPQIIDSVEHDHDTVGEDQTSERQTVEHDTAGEDQTSERQTVEHDTTEDNEDLKFIVEPPLELFHDDDTIFSQCYTTALPPVTLSMNRAIETKLARRRAAKKRENRLSRT